MSINSETGPGYGEQTQLAREQEAKLVKSLRRVDVILFIVAAVIALDVIGTIAAGGPQSLFWGIFLMATFMIPSAMIFAETGAAFPQEGGPYQWTKLAYGRLVAGVTSVLYWITNPIWLGGALVSIAYTAFDAYVHPLPAGSIGDWVFKLAFVWVAILLAVVSLKTGKIFVNVGAWAKLAVLAMLIITTVIYGIKNGFQPLSFSDMTPTMEGFLGAAPVILFAYVGFEAPSAASEEIIDPAADTAPSIRRGSFIAVAAYLLPVLAIMLVVPAGDLDGIEAFMKAFETVFSIYGGAAHTLLTITALLLVYALVNQGSSWMIATDRIQAMAAADGTFFGGYFGEFNEKLGTPLRVNIMSGVMSSIFVAASMTLAQGDAGAVFGVVLFCAISTLLVSYLTIVPALMKLKRIYPDVHRPYSVPGGSRGFHILGIMVVVYIAIGSVVAMLPGVLESALGQEYDYMDIWGTSKASVIGFTLGTFLIVVLIGVAGYLGAGKVRAGLITDANND